MIKKRLKWRLIRDFAKKHRFFAAFYFKYSELILHRILHGIAQVLALALDERHDKTLD